MRASLVISLIAICLPALAAAQPPAPVYMEADSLAYDNQQAIVVAHGNVEVVRGDRVLFADRIYYYQNQDVVKARGNISLLQPDGNVLFADQLVLEKAFKTGIVEQFKARLSDNSAFAAAEARRLDESRVELSKAVYSPCKICEEDPSADPLWQIKSDKVEIDTEAQRVTYDDATFEVYGVPVGYTPYFSHPTPGADRTSGFLRPEYSRSSNLGFSIRTPYYLNIAPDKDATITPWITSKEGPIVVGEYRQRTDNGYFEFNGSATFPEKRDNATGAEVPGNEFRGHLFAKGSSALSEHWRWGFDINRSSDDTYLRRYRFGNYETLTSRAFAERLQERNYAIVEGLTFQGLEEDDDPDQEPFILPSARVHLESQPLVMNSRASLDASVLALTREEGAETRRLTVGTTYNIPYVTEGGHVLEAEIGARADVYDQSNLPLADGSEFSGTESRFVPHAALKWRYPLMAQVQNTRLTVEPTAQIVTTTRGHNPDTIANEDSLTPEFNHLNLLDRNRFAGFDRIEEGTRAMAAVRGKAALPGGDTVSAMVGQEVRLDGEHSFPVNNDPGRDASDIVGQLGYDGSDLMLDAMYRLDTRDFELRRTELRGLYNYGRGTITADYVRIDDDAVLDDRDDITASASLQATDTLNLSVFGRRDLLRDDMVIAGVGAFIDYDCVNLYTNFTREFTRDRDFEPDTSLTLRVGLKNIN